ncbi:MAG: hypothetical protein N7Q72_00105, partial [Spiroplasma sp. Tabriz.8]|nr:hypothetical protein [Spiroplasma sp. Tabriz.8]
KRRLLGSTPGSPGSFYHCRAQSNQSDSKEEFDPGSEGTLAICLTHASRTLFSGSWAKRLLAKACLAQEVGTVENK